MKIFLLWMFLSYMDIFWKKKWCFCIFSSFVWAYNLSSMNPQSLTKILYTCTHNHKHTPTHTSWIGKHSSIPKILTQTQTNWAKNKLSRRLFPFFFPSSFYFLLFLLYWDLLGVCFDCVALPAPPSPGRPSWLVLPLGAQSIEDKILPFHL